MKIKSVAKYQRYRGWRKETDTSKHNNTTSNGKMAFEYWNLLIIKQPNIAVQEFLKKWEEVN
jgi:hypothetical protein